MKEPASSFIINDRTNQSGVVSNLLAQSKASAGYIFDWTTFLGFFKAEDFNKIICQTRAETISSINHDESII